MGTDKTTAVWGSGITGLDNVGGEGGNENGWGRDLVSEKLRNECKF